MPGLTDEQFGSVLSVSIVKNVPRKHLFLQEGEICNHKIFVLSGLLRNYNIAEDGNEYNLKFTPEYNWTTDSESYFNKTPSKYNIEAIEASEVILWSHEDFLSLRTAVPAVGTFSENLIIRNMGETQKRVLINISATAEEKYEHFITSFPNVFRRLPLHMIASYLGVSRETLTRIRHAQLNRQKNPSIG